jgi:hypothetical protein
VEISGSLFGAQFLADDPDLAPAGLLLHTGDEAFPLAKNILATPWWKVC